MNKRPQSDIIRIAKNLVTYKLTPIDKALARAEDALFGCLAVDQEENLPIPESLKAWLQQAKKSDRKINDSPAYKTYQSP